MDRHIQCTRRHVAALQGRNPLADTDVHVARPVRDRGRHVRTEPGRLCAIRISPVRGRHAVRRVFYCHRPGHCTDIAPRSKNIRRGYRNTRLRDPHLGRVSGNDDVAVFDFYGSRETDIDLAFCDPYQQRSPGLERHVRTREYDPGDLELPTPNV